MTQEKLLPQFAERCRRAVTDTHNTGRGFCDMLTDLYERCYPS